MSAFAAALHGELLKLLRSRVLWIAAAALCLGPAMGSVFVVVLRSPALAGANPALATKAALTGFTTDWNGFLGLLSQVIGVGGVMVFGFITSWVFGREFSDRTVKDLLVLPVTRTTIVTAKLVAVLLACVSVAMASVVVGLGLGVLLHLDGFTDAARLHSVRILGSTLLTLALCPPAAFVASAGRGYLAPLGFVVLMVVVAQIFGALGIGTLFPWAIPGLYSGLAPTSQASLGPWSYVVLWGATVAGSAATILWWKYADQSE